MSNDRNLGWAGFNNLNRPLEARFNDLRGRNWASNHGSRENRNYEDPFADFFRDPDRFFRDVGDDNPVRPNRPTANERLPAPNARVPSRTPAREVSSTADSVNTVTNVDLSVRANTDLHKTAKFDMVRRDSILIVRRGQGFTIQLSFRNSFNPKTDLVKLLFELGTDSNIIKGTKQLLDVETDPLPIKHWGALQKSIQGNRLWVECLAAPNTPIGAWKLSILVERSSGNGAGKTFVYKHEQPIFILYNPWNTVDAVYMEDENWKKEGVLRDVGKIWMGTTRDIHSRMWSYGQFEENVLNCAFLALDASRLPYENRGDPVLVARAISAVVNSLEDEGIIEGNWSGTYKGGTSPTEWQGSVQIMQKYFKTRKPVKYGQCWVFAGVVTTILRAFGIPARTISNFNSAHDTNSNLSIDEVYDNKMEIVESQSRDSIWNFHVWNECWMSRPDLPKGNGGWQLLDGTPQEQSGSMHRCGPVSVNAIRCGYVGLQYDTPFAFAEVNADVVKWIVERTNLKPKFLERDETRVGQFISCVKPNSNSNIDDDRLDLTEEYKPAEKSAENKAVVLNALNVSKSTSLEVYGNPMKDVKFELDDKVNIGLGEDFDIALKMTNLISGERTLEISMHLYTVYYTGIIHEKIKSAFFNKNLRENDSSECKLEVKAEDYLELIKDQCTFHVTCLAVVKETNQVFSSVDDFNIVQPVVQIQVHGGPLKLNTPSKLTARFVNPLKKTLHASKWILEGPGIKKPKEISSQDIPAKSPVVLEATIIPKASGNKTILISFSSTELNDIEGYLHVKVT